VINAGCILLRVALLFISLTAKRMGYDALAAPNPDIAWKALKYLPLLPNMEIRSTGRRRKVHRAQVSPGGGNFSLEGYGSS
jgi:hypothetical protein